MRRAWPTCEDVCAFLLALALLALSTVFLIGCGGGGITSPSSSTGQALALEVAGELEARIGGPRFTVFFDVPPREGIAGWAVCRSFQPFPVGLNRDWVETVSRQRLKEVIAHEMCHHLVGSCWDEVKAEECASGLY